MYSPTTSLRTTPDSSSPRDREFAPAPVRRSLESNRHAETGQGVAQKAGGVIEQADSGEPDREGVAPGAKPTGRGGGDHGDTGLQAADADKKRDRERSGGPLPPEAASIISGAPMVVQKT